MVLRGNQGGDQGGNRGNQQNKRDSKNAILGNGYVTVMERYVTKEPNSFKHALSSQQATINDQYRRLSSVSFTIANPT